MPIRYQKRSIAASPVGLALLLGASAAAAAPTKDLLVQAPSIGQPTRGSIAGSLSRLAFGPAALARGAYSLPLPLSAPAERGPLLASVVPAYSAEGGMSEWGVGWQNDLTIRRHRVVGQIDYGNDDEFTSPWGRLLEGDDGAYYPAGLRTMVKLESVGGDWRATTSDGTRYYFEAADAVATPYGTYAWHLSRVENAFGDATKLTWTWNESGRAFLSEVHWGGRPDGRQYRMSFAYEPLPTPLVTYVPGKKMVLDRRVASVSTAVLNGGAYAERWRHDLSYRASPNGPAFYLASVTRRYASGATDPPVTYDYDFSSDQLATAQFEAAPSLDAYLGAYGSGAIQPDRASMTDLERNGLTDLEVHLDQTMVRQTEAGYVFEPLAAPTGGENPLCRPPPAATNKPRLLARMHGEAEQPQVVVTSNNSTGTQTKILICNRAGIPQFEQQFAGAWALNANTRLADLDLDQRPDIVRVGFGSVQILKNTSASPAAFSFAPGPSAALTPKVTPTASWVLDVNGDGHPDLMVRHAGGVVVWRGVGFGRFEDAGSSFLFTTAGGAPLAGLSNYEFSHGDFNNDGLSDLILTKGQTVLLFTNRGSSYVETKVAAFASIPWTVSFPVVADLSGSGNEQIVMADGAHARILQLSRASTGLITKADDGKGTVINFGYGRVRPVPGANQLDSILTSMSVASSGYDAVSYAYEYGAPAWHTRGKYLVGFAEARKASPFLRESVSFYNDDDIAGVVTGSVDRDQREPGLERFSTRALEPATFHGVPWLRLLREESGFRDAAGSRVTTRSEVLAYERGVCPTVIETSGPHGVERQETALTTVPGLDPELSCVTASQRTVGTHPDPAFDFDYRVDVERDQLGRLLRASQAGPSGPVPLQEVTYDSAGRVATVTSPGTGTSRFTYDATTGQLVSVTAPDGVVESVVERDPLSDALVHTHIARGQSGWSNFASYDAQERLQKTWDDLSGASPTQPLNEIAYFYATANAPGLILERRLVDAAAGTAAEVADILAADGAPLAKAARQPAGWSLSTISQISRNGLERRTLRRDHLASLAGLTHASLLSGATPLGASTTTGLGNPLASWTTVQDGVTGQHDVGRALQGDELVTTTTENLAHVTSTGAGADGRTRWFRDQAGVVTAYAYDVMGRLRRVRGPNSEHRLDYDGYGRPALADREGVQRVEWSYDPTGRVAERRERGRDGALDRQTRYEYDTIGRLARTLETKAATGETRAVTTHWDGALPGGGAAPGQLGYATAIETADLSKTTLRSPDGRTASVRWALGGWRSVAQSSEYYANGTLKRATLRVEDNAGTTLAETVKEYEYDGFGRLARCRVNGADLYTMRYDAEGRVQAAQLADGEVALAYDPTTRGRRGYTMTGEITGAVTWSRNARGRTSLETYELGDDAVHRSYTYDARGFLASSADETGTASYAYDAAGLISSSDDARGSRPIGREASAITAGAERYDLDALGRVVAHGDLHLAYGPSGELERATRGAMTLRYAYDEAGQRVLKFRHGAPVAAFIGGAYLDADKLVEPVEIEGVFVGVLENGVLKRLPFDPRGSALADENGALSPATPYGVREAWGPLAEAIDYVQKGYDRDLGVVRMGVRDYDPLLGQFWTPDPLFLTSPDRCVGSPTECNLYGYAKNDPVGFVDPTGTDAKHRISPPGFENHDQDAADARQKTGKSYVPSHGLATGDRVVSAVDYAVTLENVQNNWRSDNVERYRRCFVGVCSGVKYELGAKIPQSDLNEISDALLKLPTGVDHWQFKTKGGYEVRFMLVMPIAGELTDASASTQSSVKTTTGMTFKEYSENSSSTSANVGLSVGDPKSVGASFGASGQEGSKSGTERVTSTNTETSRGTNVTYKFNHRAESGLLLVGVWKPGMEGSWTIVRGDHEGPNQSLIVQHAHVPDPAGN
ncbi:MAG: hypothetical protein MUF34_08700 [Polyangiaceae bacterium]|nr:hypothetical protein [Polyangiaceae bacterium]